MKHILTVVLWLFSWPAFSQSSPSLFPATDYPQDYFRDPLDIPMSLAANFGELRPNHYHMGLDIRTQRRENLPVRAAADGYVCRVQIEPEGFGQAIYIRHPTGYTTVYGHLNRFFPALAAYVGEQQYRQQSWAVDLAIPPELFPLTKGQLIAYSGNTGGSQGPHLHFEIRMTRGDINLNPLLFGLPVPDRVPPSILRLAWYDGNKGIYDQSPAILPVHPVPLRAPGAAPRRLGAAGSASATARSEGSFVEYALSSGILTVPVTRIGFAISAFDAQSGSKNPNGIYRAVLSDDGKPVIGFQMDHISYDDTRHIDAHIDFTTRMRGGPFLQQLFFLPGYPFPSIYRIPGSSGGIDPASVRGNDSVQRGSPAARPNDGFVDLSDGRVHKIRVAVTDPRGNRGLLTFRLRYRAGDLVPAPVAGGKTFYPGMVDGQETEDYAFYLGEKSLYDSAHIDAIVAGYPGSGLSLAGGVTPVFNIGNKWIPLADPMLVRLRLPESAAVLAGQPATARDKIVMVCSQGNDKVVERPEWQGRWASAQFRRFGAFQLVYDSIAPVILPVGPLEGADLGHAARIAFDIRDNLGALRRFRAELDGHWLCFTNDKGLDYIYRFDGHCAPGPHTLIVAVEDVAGNRTEQAYHFNR